MTHEELAERVAKNISRMVPVDAGSRWCDGHGHDFPREYSEAEKRLIRGVAIAAIAEVLAVLKDPTPEMIAAGAASGKGGNSFAALYRAMLSASPLVPRAIEER